MNCRNGEGGLLGKMLNVVEEDVTTKTEMKSIRGKIYRFVGEWNQPTIYEKITKIID